MDVGVAAQVPTGPSGLDKGRPDYLTEEQIGRTGSVTRDSRVVRKVGKHLVTNDRKTCRDLSRAGHNQRYMIPYSVSQPLTSATSG